MRKVIFFDLYQTLLEVQLNIRGERPNRDEEAPGWEIIASELKSFRSVGAEQLRAFYDQRRDEFYSQHDVKTYHHNLFSLLSQTLEEDLDIRLSREEVIRLLYKFRKATRGHLRLYPHVKETLGQLTGEYTLSTASHTQSCYTQLELRELDIEKFFSHFVYTSDIGLRKESPEFYMRALEIVGKGPSDCVMVGDNYDADVVVPQSIGMKAIWIKNSLTASRYPMEKEPPNTLSIDRIEELPLVI